MGLDGAPLYQKACHDLQRASNSLHGVELPAMLGKTENGDDVVLDSIRRQGAVTISALVDEMGVTATAVRQRVRRLMDEGLIERQSERKSRGRPNHRYRLTEKGELSAGTNFADLAIVLWDEIRSVADPAIQRGLLQRIAGRLTARYQERITGTTLCDRMRELVTVFTERKIPFEINQAGELPILSVLACPYPKLAEADRGVCSMEKLMLSEILGTNMRLSECRLDGANCCTFTPSVS